MPDSINGIEAVVDCNALLLQVSLILLAALHFSLSPARSAAARHAVLLWTLVAAGLCPILGIPERALGAALCGGGSIISDPFRCTYRRRCH